MNTLGNSLRIKISNLRPDTKYKFGVYAKNKHGDGALSAEAVGKTSASSKVPLPPQGLSAEAESESSVRVTWGEPLSG